MAAKPRADNKNTRENKNAKNAPKSGGKKGDNDKAGNNHETVVPQAPPRLKARRAGDIHMSSGGGSTWLLSFTDVMALMLTFFVMLFAMSEPHKSDWEGMMSAMKNEFRSFYGPAWNAGPQETINISKVNFDQALDIGYLDLLMKSAMKENKLLDNLVITRRKDKLILSLPQDMLFAPGQATPEDKGLKTLYALGGPLSRMKNQIEVVGLADPKPVTNPDATYKNNWELSLARATNVAAILKRVGYEKDITVRGLSDGRYQDLASVKDEDQRLALSRRVDIVILNHDGRKSDVFSALNFR